MTGREEVIVVLEDDAMVVVLKPSGVLSVPGREAQLDQAGKLASRPRCDQWVQTIQEARAIGESRSVSESVLGVLLELERRSLPQQQTIPRKHDLFLRHLRRILRVTDTTLFEAVWDFLQEVDTKLHRPKSRHESIPDHLVSAADLAALRTPHGKIHHVHRLDMDTSGLLVFAKTEQASAELSRQFREHDVQKCYVALVHGRLPRELDGSVIRLPIAPSPDPAQRPRQVVDHASGKPCETHLRVVEWPEAAAAVAPSNTRQAEAGGGSAAPGDSDGTECSGDSAAEYTRVELVPVTGRTHQLRVHMAAIGHPIVGDPLYGPKLGAGAGAGSEWSRLCLHARDLRFSHPVTGITVSLSAPCPF